MHKRELGSYDWIKYRKDEHGHCGFYILKTGRLRRGTDDAGMEMAVRM